MMLRNYTQNKGNDVVMSAVIRFYPPCPLLRAAALRRASVAEQKPLNLFLPQINI
jgi:hypothetical protein